MIIQSTKALLDKLPVDKADIAPVEKIDTFPDNLFAWHANYITLDRRKAVVLMNNLTKYAIVLYRPKAKDLMKFEENVRKAIKTAFQEEGIKESVINAYLEKAGEVQYSKTAGRSMVGSLNEICRIVGYYGEYLDEEHLIQKVISKRMGNYIMKYGEEYAYPNEQLFLALNRMMGYTNRDIENVLSIENYQLKIKINLEKFDIWRRIQIPSCYTFDKLHLAIQTIFGWLDYHLHDFRILEKDDSMTEETPLYALPIKIRIVDGQDPEAMEYLEPDKDTIYRDTQITLHDIFSQVNTCIYTYDFGDNWEHIIELENVIPNSTNRRIVLLERHGKRPPEDVGGENGFEEFIKIRDDKNHPEYEGMKIWSEELSEKDRTIEEINRWLRF